MQNISKRIIEAFNNIRNTSSRNQKTAILTQFIKTLNENDLKLFRSLCEHTFDYEKTFYIKKLPAYTHMQSLEPLTLDQHLHDPVYGIIPQLMSRAITGNRAKAGLLEALTTSDCPETSMLIENIIDKSFDIGCDLSTFTKAMFLAEHGEAAESVDSRIKKMGYYLVHEHKVSLCTAASEKLLDNMTYPAYGQLKYDAMRIEVNVQPDDVRMITRPGKTVTSNNPKLDSLLEIPLKRVKEVYARHGYKIKGDRIHLDGEMVFLDTMGRKLPRTTSNGIANKVIKATKEKIETYEIVFCVWDAITPEEKSGKLKIPYGHRLAILQDLVRDIPVYEVAKTTIVNNKQEAIELAIKYIKEGLEGCIIKAMDVAWTPERVKTQLKLKAARECELRIVGVNIAEDNKYHGLVGSLQCVTDDGLVYCNISGMDDDQRKEFLKPQYIGKIVTVLFNEMTTKKDDPTKFSLFLPRLVEVRYDKTKTDTYQEIKDAEYIVTV